MNCSTHTDVPAVAFCRSCGKALCADCRRVAEGTVYCAEHAPAAAASSGAGAPSYSAPPPGHANPRLAFLLGFIPGVGAIYNGQYAKGLVHAVIFGLIISIMTRAGGESEPMLAFLMIAWEFYMIFEAYHTARKRVMGEPVDEFSSLVNVRPGGRGFPTGAVTLIVLGVILLLNTLDILEFRYIARYWPVVLILAGVYMLWARLSAENSGPGQEARNEHE